MSNPSILLWDIETSMMNVGTFSLYPESINHQNIIDDWYIISAAWKFLDKPKIHAVSGLDDSKRYKKDIRDDYHVVKTIRDVLQDVDIIIGHNQNKFDIKKFKARLIFHKLPPLPKPIHSVDTLKEVKKIAAFSSNRLDYLTTHLCGQGKMPTAPGLWLKVMQGDKKALADMVKYNKVDVERLEELYLRLRPYMDSHPHVGAMKGNERDKSCPNCGSVSMTIKGYRYTASGIRRAQVQCNKCHTYHTHAQ
jgi:hypothetical protein